MKYMCLLMLLCFSLVNSEVRQADPGSGSGDEPPITDEQADPSDVAADESSFDDKRRPICHHTSVCRFANGICRRHCRLNEIHLKNGCTGGRHCKCCVVKNQNCIVTSQCKKASGVCQTAVCSTHQVEIVNGCSKANSTGTYSCHCCAHFGNREGEDTEGTGVAVGNEVAEGTGDNEQVPEAAPGEEEVVQEIPQEQAKGPE
ncbi:uncharacterized protein [Procambarus clarkii]|uniref:uncharacterized protein n=1 Tax=Procambarus clarkii TaxID=6728 RepID=UPI00374449C3